MVQNESNKSNEDRKDKNNKAPFKHRRRKPKSGSKDGTKAQKQTNPPDQNPSVVKKSLNSSAKKKPAKNRKPSKKKDTKEPKHVDDKQCPVANASHLDASANTFIPSSYTTTSTIPSRSQEPPHESNDENDKEKYQESYERSAADLEILCAAYPDEIALFKSEPMDDATASTDADLDLAMGEDAASHIPQWFPLVFTLTLPESIDDSLLPRQERRFGGNITMEFPKGYPSEQLQVVSYRTAPSIKKEHIEQVVGCVRTTALEAIEVYGGEECGLACCAAAIESWNECLEKDIAENNIVEEFHEPEKSTDDDIHWITAETTLIDRKSVFQAHVCVVNSDDMVRRAVNKLIQGSSKIQRATHNMFAYRFVERREDRTEILKHDNDDDGEDAAGSRLAQLLEMRKEDGVLVLVSRWYGGTHLGPKRFAHITNVARDLLVDCHEKGLIPNALK